MTYYSSYSLGYLSRYKPDYVRESHEFSSYRGYPGVGPGEYYTPAYVSYCKKGQRYKPYYMYGYW